jgi:glucose/arabinose dehydrogenase
MQPRAERSPSSQALVTSAPSEAKAWQTRGVLPRAERSPSSQALVTSAPSEAKVRQAHRVLPRAERSPSSQALVTSAPSEAKAWQVAGVGPRDNQVKKDTLAKRALISTALLFSTLLSADARTWQAPQGGSAQPGAGRGRGNPTAALYTERCAGCHGTDSMPGRAPSLFDDKWGRGSDDESIARIIHDGVPNTEMASFKDVLTDQQIWQLVVYLRMQAGNLKTKPTYVQDPDGQIIKSEKQRFKIEIVAREIETPWALAFLPDGRLLITERPGHLRIVEKGKLLPAVTGTPKVWERQDGGLFDVEVHPDYKKNGWIYLSYSEPLANYTPPAAPAAAPAPQGRGNESPTIPSMTVVVRGKINARNEWVDEQVIFRAPAELYTPINYHYGSRFIFDKQGHLFYAIGDHGAIMDAQDLSKPTGKIHRVNDDGSVPKDNPFVSRAGALGSIWSYGHRNPQGLAWDPATGKLWETEHGPQGGDEVNVIEPGHNYGWGVITNGVQPGITKRSEPGMENPIVYYTPTIAPSGITFSTSNQYPQWKNNLFISGLAGQQLRRLEIKGTTVTHQEVVFNQFGRVHDVIVGPDGYLYVTLQLPGQVVSQSTPGMVARLVPVKN